MMTQTPARAEELSAAHVTQLMKVMFWPNCNGSNYLGNCHGCDTIIYKNTARAGYVEPGNIINMLCVCDRCYQDLRTYVTVPNLRRQKGTKITRWNPKELNLNKIPFGLVFEHAESGKTFFDLVTSYFKDDKTFELDSPPEKISNGGQSLPVGSTSNVMQGTLLPLPSIQAPPSFVNQNVMQGAPLPSSSISSAPVQNGSYHSQGQMNGFVQPQSLYLPAQGPALVNGGGLPTSIPSIPLTMIPNSTPQQFLQLHAPPSGSHFSLAMVPQAPLQLAQPFISPPGVDVNVCLHEHNIPRDNLLLHTYEKCEAAAIEGEILKVVIGGHSYSIPFPIAAGFLNPKQYLMSKTEDEGSRLEDYYMHIRNNQGLYQSLCYYVGSLQPLSKPLSRVESIRRAMYRIFVNTNSSVIRRQELLGRTSDGQVNLLSIRIFITLILETDALPAKAFAQIISDVVGAYVADKLVNSSTGKYTILNPSEFFGHAFPPNRMTLHYAEKRSKSSNKDKIQDDE